MSQEVSRPLCNQEDIGHLLIWITRSHACRAGMGHTHAVRMGGCARRGTRGEYDYHANITLKQIGMFDRTIVRLELWFERQSAGTRGSHPSTTPGGHVP